MTTGSRYLVGLAFLSWLAAVPAGGQQPGPEPVVLTGGFADHVEPAAGGRIDWTNGYILGQGVGYGEGRDKQNELLARQAARLAALRNALALAQGIRIDASGTVAGVRDGTVRVRGLIRGHQEVEGHWFPDRDPPQAHVVVRVPLWGVSSLASLFAPAHRARLSRAGAVRRPLVVEQVDVSDFVLVIDARGEGLTSSLFPVVRDTDGGVLYDLNTLPADAVGCVPLARLVESDQSFEKLQAAIESDAPLRFMLVSHQPPSPPAQAASQPAEPGTQPTSRPAKEPTKRRARRRMVVRAAGASGEEKTEVVLTREDVDRIRRSPEGANALRQAHVVIVVDSAAAGTEGRLHPAGKGAHALAHRSVPSAIHPSPQITIRGLFCPR